LEDASSKVRELEASIEKMRAEQTSTSLAVADQQKFVERYLSKRGLLLKRREECTQKIRELGALPEEAFEKYVNTASKKVEENVKMRRLMYSLLKSCMAPMKS
jgi:structural maintenance of chromosome 3 (chondroitin sulfate proteoglycan 6)